MPKDYSKRQIITEHRDIIGDCETFFNERPLSHCITDLQLALEKHGDVILNCGMYDYYVYNVTYAVEREETDEEFERRQAKRLKDKQRRAK